VEVSAVGQQAREEAVDGLGVEGADRRVDEGLDTVAVPGHVQLEAV
jgi:hypothetical protein